MYNIETLYSSYQELLLDLDIYGRLMESQSLDDKEEFKELLFQEYAKAHPIPTLESRDYELSEPVSAEYHVSYMHELELSQNEEIINFDDEDDEEEPKGIDNEDLSLPSDFPKDLFQRPVSIEERDNILVTNKYFITANELEDFTGDVDAVEGNFGSVTPSEESIFIEEPAQVDEDVGDDDMYSYNEEGIYESEDVDESEDNYSDVAEDDDDMYSYDEDEEGYSDEATEGSDDYELDFVDEVYDNPIPVVEKPRNVVVEPPPIVLPKSSPPTVEEKVDRSDLPKDVLQYLREHPRCEISEVLKYYPRKELEKYIRTGRIIKKGSKVYI